jgi:hypothetical protein
LLHVSHKSEASPAFSTCEKKENNSYFRNNYLSAYTHEVTSVSNENRLTNQSQIDAIGCVTSCINQVRVRHD